MAPSGQRSETSVRGIKDCIKERDGTIQQFKFEKIEAAVTKVFVNKPICSQVPEGFMAQLKEYFDNPWMAYLIYLVDVTARFVVRDGDSRTSDVDKLIKIWFELMELVMNKLK